MKDVVLDGKKLSLDHSKIIGSGGEADVYDIGKKRVLKLFKKPNHHDFDGMPEAQKGAKYRIAEHQKKLPLFPKNLHENVVSPKSLATSISGKIVGYSMNFISGGEVLLKYGEKSFRDGLIPDSSVVSVFEKMHEITDSLHSDGVVIGDNNDLNWIVRDKDIFLVDTDAMQFGGFLSSVYTDKFLDPLLSTKDNFMLAAPHNNESDWYAYSVMLMQSLLFVGPYGGVFKPKNASDRVVKSSRPLKRITVFNTDVKYPKPARPMDALPDEVLSYFEDVFVNDKREVFPKELLQKFQYGNDGNLLSTLKSTYAPEMVKETHTGKVSATMIFDTNGKILHATVQKGKLLYLFHNNGEFFRENDVSIAKGKLEPAFRYRISGDTTILARAGKSVIIKGDESSVISVDSIQNLSLIDTYSGGIHYILNGQLKKVDSSRLEYPELIGNTLANQTLFWSSDKLGFGFYRAGQLSRYFIYNSSKRGINDSIKLPPIRGQIIDSTATISERRIWFFLSVQENGKTINKCFVLNERGVLLGSFESESDDGNWLSTIRGHVAVSDFLLAATDDGIVRVKVNGSSIGVDKEFPETARFVHSKHRLLVGKSGILVIKSGSIWNLQLK